MTKHSSIEVRILVWTAEVLARTHAKTGASKSLAAGIPPIKGMACSQDLELSQ